MTGAKPQKPFVKPGDVVPWPSFDTAWMCIAITWNDERRLWMVTWWDMKRGDFVGDPLQPSSYPERYEWSWNHHDRRPW